MRECPRTPSGAKTGRAKLRKAPAALEAGDVLVLTRLDRLARSTRDLLNILAAFSDRKKQVSFPADTWADTTTADGRLMLSVLGELAEFERQLIRARTSGRRKRAVASGVTLQRRRYVALRRAGRCEALPLPTTSIIVRFRG